ncbi:ribonuclease H-like domain-containing protein [Tanacetum coccineum]|uniref:Ribonuclease H-like domain-containing protein n=1 Tax=Tanacetum coccineum TaxID=301880 RepID=A0ABQ5G529_9ASTR
MKNNRQKNTFDSGVTKDINHKNFFDNENPKRPNDDGRVSSYDDGRVSSYNVDQNDDDSGATSIDENTHIKGNVLDETDLGVKYGVEKVVNYSNLSADNYNFASSLNKSIGPTCYKDAILDKNPLAANGFLRLNTKQCKIERYKARLVAKDFNQREGIDFDEIFSPVIKLSTVRCLIAISVRNKWPLFQLDINNAFLYEDLEEYVYITIPQGFSDKNNQNKACKLIKSLDGLKQDNKFIDLLVYVDDIVITRNCVNEIDQFKT